MIDVVQQINAVRRVVGTRTLDAGQAHTVIISQTYDAAVEDVWDACTTPERIVRWFLPVTGDLQLNGRYHIQGNAEGTITRCDPPHSFAATWEYGGTVSWIEVRFSAEAKGKTRFELEHIASIDDEKWGEFGPGAVGVGWDMALAGLAIHLLSDATINPDEAAAWTASAEGIQFMSLSSQNWRDANIQAGTSSVEAQSAADRTIAAYTGTAPVS